MRNFGGINFKYSYRLHFNLVIRIYLDKNLVYPEAPAARSCSYKNYLHKFQVY